MKFEISDGKNLVTFFGGGLFYLPGKHKTFGANFGADFGETFGNFI